MTVTLERPVTAVTVSDSRAKGELNERFPQRVDRMTYEEVQQLLARLGSSPTAVAMKAVLNALDSRTDPQAPRQLEALRNASLEELIRAQQKEGLADLAVLGIGTVGNTNTLVSPQAVETRAVNSLGATQQQPLVVAQEGIPGLGAFTKRLPEPVVIDRVRNDREQPDAADGGDEGSAPTLVNPELEQHSPVAGKPPLVPVTEEVNELQPVEGDSASYSRDLDERMATHPTTNPTSLQGMPAWTVAREADKDVVSYSVASNVAEKDVVNAAEPKDSVNELSTAGMLTDLPKSLQAQRATEAVNVKAEEITNKLPEVQAQTQVEHHLRDRAEAVKEAEANKLDPATAQKLENNIDLNERQIHQTAKGATDVNRLGASSPDFAVDPVDKDWAPIHNTDKINGRNPALIKSGTRNQGTGFGGARYPVAGSKEAGVNGDLGRSIDDQTLDRLDGHATQTKTVQNSLPATGRNTAASRAVHDTHAQHNRTRTR